MEGLDELRQTADLMQLGSLGKEEEWYDSSVRNRRFRSVDKMNGTVLLDRVTQGVAAAAAAAAQATPVSPVVTTKPSGQFANFSSKFGINKGQ
ncbi:hypothetical protein LTR28_002927 [Elasticomyces elasticus]|nr:hypothetical protein LTR28_002927 [Elasticomyces elasticus]